MWKKATKFKLKNSQSDGFVKRQGKYLEPLLNLWNFNPKLVNSMLYYPRQVRGQHKLLMQPANPYTKPEREYLKKGERNSLGAGPILQGSFELVYFGWL